jgi:polar amino acid transport system substrate-binding protein
MTHNSRHWLPTAMIALVLLHLTAPAKASDVKPCEPTKLATRYPDLVGKTITIGQDGTSLPFSFRDPNNPDHLLGADADLARAVFGCIGVPVNFVTAAWSGLLPAVAGGRIDIMWDNLYYTPERAAKVDFVVFAKTEDAALLPKGNPKHLTSLDDLCGTRAIGGLGTVEIVLLQNLSKKCSDAGKPPIDAITYQDRATAWQMVETNRADIMLGSSSGVQAIVAEKPQLLEGGFTFLADTKVGAATGKGRQQLEQALVDGLAAMQASGEMARIYVQYKLNPTLILPPQIMTK